MTQGPVTLSHEYNVKPSCYKHPVSARDNVCRGSRRGSELIYELAKINMDGPTPLPRIRSGAILHNFVTIDLQTGVWKMMMVNNMLKLVIEDIYISANKIGDVM